MRSTCAYLEGGAEQVRQLELLRRALPQRHPAFDGILGVEQASGLLT